MKATHSPARELKAPETLGLETRSEFRRAGIGLLDSLPEGEGSLIIDLTATPPNGYALIGPGGLATYVTPVLTDPDKDRHSGAVNMSFGDGHVQRVTQADILAYGDRWTRIDN